MPLWRAPRGGSIGGSGDGAAIFFTIERLLWAIDAQ
jgi:hypothetical protein